MENYKDRGMKKWQGIMLTEHIKKIKEWEAEEEYTPRPKLEEFELDLIAEELERAYAGTYTIKLTYWRNGQLSTDYGVPIEIERTQRRIVIDDPFSTNKYLFDEIISVAIIN